ncbi:vWA domain-containing protein [Halobellus clavatus]|uniref:SipW-cognate class signal peptide n=1 Tax=Halobellus clavatus TaxID=660517 RepID=A0A1H3H6I1_9EURY|nr:vWA domain-containing protein [Halobellus clavatus]SDY10239.1 SipW-cognate class signal peptide [Halobellus clavatus]
MTEHEFDLSRRSVLGALGAIGAASAGAGLGTSALFSDEETFEDNRLVAGELDLKMDWEEHYSFPQIYGEGFGDPTVGLDIRDTPADGYRAFPPGLDEEQEPFFYVNEGDVPEYMRKTSIEAFPDTNNDGTANLFDLVGFPGRPGIGESEPCEVLADVGGESDGLGAYADLESETIGRTQNADTYADGAEDPVLPLINIGDVKPGDFGEITFSLHLCDNDGYVWMNADNVAADENGVMEPESSEEVEGDVVELLDEIQVAAWYDNNCNNLVDIEPGEVDVMAVADTSGSIDTAEKQNRLIEAANAFVETLPTDGSVQTGLVTFGGGTVTITDQLGPVTQFLDGNGNGEVGNRLTSFGGNTPMAGALEAAEAELNSSAARPGADKIILLVTDGGPNYAENATYTVSTSDASVNLGPYPGGRTSPGATINQEEIDETITIAQGIESSGIDILTAGVLTDTEAEAENVEGPDNLNAILRQIAGAVEDYYNTEFGPDLVTVAQLIAAQITAGDEVFLRGSLREALTELQNGDGVPLDGGLETAFDELADPETDADRQPFDASATYCVGFSWWLPHAVSNGVQSDSVMFDLGFYTEQARNNDGSGQPA